MIESCRYWVKDRPLLSCRQNRGGLFPLPDERYDVTPEELDLFVEMKEAEKDEVGAGGFQIDDAVGDLLRRADEVRAEAIVVLNQIRERGLGPVAFALGGSLSGILDLVAEGIDCVGIGLVDDLGENLLRFCLSVSGDRERVHADLDRAAVLGRLATDVGYLLVDFIWRIAVGEVPIRDTCRHIARRSR